MKINFVLIQKIHVFFGNEHANYVYRKNSSSYYKETSFFMEENIFFRFPNVTHLKKIPQAGCFPIETKNLKKPICFEVYADFESYKFFLVHLKQMKEVKLNIDKGVAENGYYINSNLPKGFKCGYHFVFRSNKVEMIVSAATDFLKNQQLI